MLRKYVVVKYYDFCFNVYLMDLSEVFVWFYVYYVLIVMDILCYDIGWLLYFFLFFLIGGSGIVIIVLLC